MIAHTPPHSRKTDILDALTQMLAAPTLERITTAGLARQLNLSEAALYRHFASKTQMFESLIDITRRQLQEDLEHIEHTEPDGRQRLRKQAGALLLFAERHKGLARILTGEAITHEDASLVVQLVDLHVVLERGLHASALLAAKQRILADQPAPEVRAGVLMDWLLGRWLRYSQSHWTASPTENHAQALALLGL